MQTIYLSFDREMTYATELDSGITKSKIIPFAATRMDLEIVILSEVSHKEKYCTISLKCKILKYGTNELKYKTEIESQM